MYILWSNGMTEEEEEAVFIEGCCVICQFFPLCFGPPYRSISPTLTKILVLYWVGFFAIVMNSLRVFAQIAQVFLVFFTPIGTFLFSFSCFLFWTLRLKLIKVLCFDYFNFSDTILVVIYVFMMVYSCEVGLFSN